MRRSMGHREDDVDHCLGDVEARFVVADEAVRSACPAAGLLDDIAAWQNFKDGLLVAASEDFEDKYGMLRYGPR